MASVRLRQDVRRLDVRGRRELVPVEHLRRAAPRRSRRSRASTRRSRRTTRTPSSTASAWSGVLTDTWAVRGGYFFDESPAPPASISPLLPDANRHGFCLGGSWTLGHSCALDAAAWYVRAAERSTDGHEPRRLRRHLQEPRAHAGRLARLHVLAAKERPMRRTCCPRPPRSPAGRGAARRPRHARPPALNFATTTRSATAWPPGSCRARSWRRTR